MQEIKFSDIRVNKYYFIFSKFHNDLCKKESYWNDYRKIIAKVKSKIFCNINGIQLHRIIFTDVMHVPSKICGTDYHFQFNEDKTKNSEIIYRCTQHPYKCCNSCYNRILNLLLYRITGERNLKLTYF